jgi:hypothetical protein
VLPATSTVDSGAAAAAGLLFHVSVDSFQLIIDTGCTPTTMLGTTLSSLLPNSRTFADEMPSAAPTLARSKLRYVSRL